MIDSSLPISFFTPANSRKLLKTDVILARPMAKNECYVDYKNQPLNLVDFINVEVQVGKRKIKNARVNITQDGKRSLIGQVWLAQLDYHVGEVNSVIWHSSVVGHIKAKIVESSKIRLFTRKGRTKRHEIKIAFKENAKITQQKRRRVLLQLQEAVEKEIDKLLEKRHIH